MQSFRLFLSFSLFALGLTPSYSQNLSIKDIPNYLRNDWYGVYFKNAKIGHYHHVRIQNQAGIRDTYEVHLKVPNEEGEPIGVQETQALTFEPASPFKLREGIFFRTDETGYLSVSLQKTGGKGFEAVTKNGKGEKKEFLEPIDYTLAEFLRGEMWIRSQPKLGSTVSYRNMDIKALRFDPFKGTLLEIKKTQVYGVPVRFFEASTQWVDKDILGSTRFDDLGRVLTSKFGQQYEIRLESEILAKNHGKSQDFFLLGLIKIDKALGQPSEVKELQFEVDGPDVGMFPEGPRQSYGRAANGHATLRIGKKYGKIRPVSEKEKAVFLKESPRYPLSNLQLKALAEKGAGLGKTPEEKIVNLILFVNSHVKTDFAGFAPTIPNLLENPRGDCKANAILFAALARSIGVPAREVTGLVYLGDDTQAFGPHSWNEVVLGNQWVPVDTSMRQSEIDATHISLGSDEKHANETLSSMGKISLIRQ